MKYLSLLLIGFLVLTMTGCASIVNGVRQDVGVSSSPAGALAQSNYGLSCLTPCILSLPRRNSHTILIQKQGYEDGSASIASSPSGWLWGDLVFGGLIGLVIDFASGGAYKLKPESVNVILARGVPGESPKPEQVSDIKPGTTFVAPNPEKKGDSETLEER